MEEKERYEWNSRFDEAIKDNQTGDIVNAVEVLNEQDQKIKDLETKLAEIQNDRVGDVIINAGKKIKELQQQLAEEKNRNKKLNHEAQKYYEDAYCKNFQNQKAIRELEKVKRFLLEKIAEKQSCFDSGNYNDFADGVKTICELMLISIDNQIKSLKGENK